MVWIMDINRFLCIVVIVMCLSVHSAPSPPVLSKEDLKYIGCDVCEHMVSALKSTLDDLKAASSNKKLGELTILDTMEQICNPQNATGEWIRKLDIVESTSKGLSYLKLEQPGGISKCENECATIAKSCEMLFDSEIDLDDLSVVFIKKTSFGVRDMQKKVCSSMTNRCKVPAKHVDPKYKRIDKPFVAMKEKDLEMEKLMASMKGMGLSSSMYNRDDMAGMMGDEEDGGAYGDDYGEDGMSMPGGMAGMGGDYMPPQEKEFKQAGAQYEF